MKVFSLFLIVCVLGTAVIAMPDYDHRFKRETVAEFEKKAGGAIVSGSLDAPKTGGLEGNIGATHIVFKNDLGILDANVRASSSLAIPGETTKVGGGLDFVGKGITGSLGVDHTLNGGTLGNLGVTKNIFDDQRGRLDASAHASRTWNVPDPMTNLGGRLDYSGHGAIAGLGLSKTLGRETTLDANLGRSWKLGPNTDISASGTYSRMFDVPGSRPNYGAIGTLRIRFRRSPDAEYYGVQDEFAENH